MSLRLSLVFAVFVMRAGACLAADEIEWLHRAARGGVTLTANPLTAAQRTAFYLARGFAEPAIRPYAQACGFSFAMRNSGAGPVRTALADWQAVGADGRRAGLRPPAAWGAEWVRANVTEPARVAFRWAQFQADLAFAPGDWIMGMAALERRPDGAFRLNIPLSLDRRRHEITLDALACAQ